MDVIKILKNLKYSQIIAFAAVAILAFALGFGINKKSVSQNAPVEKSSALASEQNSNDLVEKVLPSAGVELPVSWGNFGKQLVEKGVINQQQFESIYNQRGGMSEYETNMLSGENNGKLKITSQNAGFLLNLLWAFGLGNKNRILEEGDMVNPEYGGAGNFASTGGWTIAKGKAMNHYSKHSFIQLSAEQQADVEEVSKNIYRPCCGNSTYFPDCNHGMAMLGLLELMAYNNVSKQDMYKYALAVNSYWFPNNYMTIAAYFKEVNKTEWADVDPKLALSFDYSSSPGYNRLLDKINPQQAPSSGGGCSV